MRFPSTCWLGALQHGFIYFIVMVPWLRGSIQQQFLGNAHFQGGPAGLCHVALLMFAGFQVGTCWSSP